MTGFQGRVAVVTGGGSGIGAAVVARLREAGAAVEIADLQPGDATTAPVDVTQDAAVVALAHRVRHDHGRLDVLVNCAGAIAVGTVTDGTPEDWNRLFDVNVRSIWLMGRHFVPLMPAGSAIVNTASGAGLRAIPRMAAYVASKHAVVGLTRAMAVDHAEAGIRVNCVCPGLVDTPMAAAAQRMRPEPVRSSVDSRSAYLVKQEANPDEIAASICFLASSDARYITGSTLAVDGGRCQH